MRAALERVRAWANDTMADDTLPSWAWYEVAKLRGDIDSVLTRVAPLVFDAGTGSSEDALAQKIGAETVSSD